MNKPFYSKRRLKKMGVKIENKKNEIEVNLISNSGYIRQSQNIIKMIKASDKPVRINMDSVIASAASIICLRADKLINKMYGYD